MKAMVFDKFGPPEVMELREIDKPTPQGDEVLVRVHAASLNRVDVVFRSGALKIFGLVRPMMTGIRVPRVSIVGFDISGEVEAVGPDVKSLKVGDQIYGGIIAKNGGHAEYACISEKTAAIKPANMTYEEASAVTTASMTALFSLRNGNIQSGQKVLINGASGGVGTYAVQLAKALETEVAGVCSTGNLSMAESLGADTVIDYTKEDFTKSGQTYDLIYDAAGKSSFSKCKSSLKPNGFYVTTDFMSPKYTLLQILWTSIVGGKKVKTVWANFGTADLDYLRGLIEEGKVKSVIDRRYPLEQTVEAYRYFEQGHAKGKVVVNVLD